jgi:valyl-tRNA synthetase
LITSDNMNKNKKEMGKNWEPKEKESLIYKSWEESGYFNPDNLDLPENAPSYTIILPPPNITDKLHVGHSSMLAIEDLMIRFHRMKGFRTLWVPGTDHAAIATQNVVEKKIMKEQCKTRHDLGKEKFLEKAWNFLKETQNTILMQTRKMGASLDWSREAFTLDEQRKKAVRKMFIDMYKAGAIYRGERIVNWCPRCHSTLADDEVEHEEKKAKLYWIKYGPFVLATSRPETKLGDTAVAVHPSDKRYKDMTGKDYDIPGVLGDFRIKVVADRAVDPEFGSGAIKVTPAHSFVDNEIAERHNLPVKKIIDEDGKMMENCGKYFGMTTLEAREQIVADMEKMGLIDHIEEDYIHNTSQCYRCDSIIEPSMSEQWFVSVDKKLEKLGGMSL